MKLYYWYFSLASAYVLIGLWDYFRWAWQLPEGTALSGMILMPPTLGALLVVISPLLKTPTKTWFFMVVMLNLLAMLAEIWLLVASAQRGDWAASGREMLLILFGIAALWQSYQAFNTLQPQKN